MDRKRALKLRFRRQFRVQQRQVQELGATAERRLEDDFFKRLERLSVVRRFVAAWVLLVLLLIGSVVAQTRALSGYYQTLQPIPGGTYTEGVLGAFTNANPIYATNLADTTVSKLIFAGLFTYDNRNQLVGDLAESIAADDRGTTYTVKLRPNLTWQDGQPLTSADVLFTYQVIQNPDARSPLFGSFSGVRVAAPDARTITFTLPSVLASFPYSLTNGIVPKHLLGGTAMADMRSVSFNSTQPVGAGPFQWRAIELTGGSADKREEHIALKAFDGYHFGKPKLSGFVVRTFRQPEQLIKSFRDQEVNGVAGLTDVPKELQHSGGVRIYNLPLTAAVMTFFRSSNTVFADARVRQALVQATDTNSILASLDYATQPVREPFLHGQLGFNPANQQAGYNVAAANSLLDAAGWTRGAKNLRYLNGQPLRVDLYFRAGGEYERVAKQLAAQWRAVGVAMQLTGQNEADFQSTLTNAPAATTPPGSTYDALLYGISIGVDPDVYVYWDGSQIDARSPSRLNFSVYNSAVANASLEAGRTRLDPVLRTLKYQPFLQSWQADAPALGLYQPRFLYLTHGPVYGLEETPINGSDQRLDNVWNWQVREARR